MKAITYIEKGLLTRWEKRETETDKMGKEINRD